MMQRSVNKNVARLRRLSCGECGVSVRHLGLVGGPAVVYELDTWD